MGEKRRNIYYTVKKIKKIQSGTVEIEAKI
jgi:hypothetical protein